MPIRCAIYARYSSDQQRPESLADQIRHCEQEAVRHPDWVILDNHIYTDQALSGVSVEGREGLQRLVQSALGTRRPFDLILVDDTSRLARDVVDSVRPFRELRAHDVDLYFVNQGLHSARDNAEFLLAIYGAMDSEYIRELGRKTHRGLEGQARKGWSAGGIAYGYRREPVYDATQTDRDGQARRVGVRWVLDPNEAEIVRRIFRWYADGLGMGTIAARLNAQRMPSPRQAKGHRARHDSVGAGWDLSAVRVLLTNELYRGRLIWNRSRWIRLPGTRRRRRQIRPESEWVVVERPDLRIVEEALWEQAQTRRARVRMHYEDPSQFGKSRTEYGAYLLSGRLHCGECGGSFTICTGKPSRYGCTRHWRRGPAACSNNLLVRRDLVEQKIAELLQAELYTRDGVRRVVETVNARQTAAVRRVGAGPRPAAASRAGAGPRSRVSPRGVQDLRATLLTAGARARQLLHADLERIVIHPIRSETKKPFARAEVITTGKGLLARVAFVVAGAGFEPATFGL